MEVAVYIPRDVMEQYSLAASREGLKLKGWAKREREKDTFIARATAGRFHYGGHNHLHCWRWQSLSSRSAAGQHGTTRARGEGERVK